MVTLPSLQWPYQRVLVRLGLALCTGLLVGLERERRAKEMGMRGFAFVSLLGCLGGLLGPAFALAALGMLTALVALVTLDHLRRGQGIELTTSAATLVMGFGGILCGQGHTLTPVAVAVISTALLAWKTPLAGVSLGLTEAELRSTIVFALLAFVIYPALPEGPVGPWGALEPRTAWMTVLLLAGISFVNYVLWKIYGAQGVEFTGFLGGLVNSTVTVGEMAARVKDTGGRLADQADRGIMLATAAMLVRNLALLAPTLVFPALLPLGLMLGASLGASWHRHRDCLADQGPGMELGSPFSLLEALRFGLIFLVLQVAGVVAQRLLGQPGVYATALLGGLVSSASTVAALAAMAGKGLVPAQLGGSAAMLACLASTLVNVPLLLRSRQRSFIRKAGAHTALVLVLGLAGILVQDLLAEPPAWTRATRWR
jgi:uncharacterized membrane protein (DUF4010 family)